MNWKKITFIFIVFLTFVASGLLLSNVQSREANQLLDAHGLSNSTRYFYSKKNITVSEFISYLNKNYHSKRLQLHLTNRKNHVQTLIWANHSLLQLPVESGRYFAADDFQGQVSFAVLGSNTKKNVLDVQNNKYLKYNQQYYSVIGTIKERYQDKNNSYYLSTGINQPTGKFKLQDYQIILDCNSQQSLKKIAHHVGGTLYTPDFVRKHQIYRFSVIREIFFILLLWLIAIGANALIAMMQWRQVKLTHLKGSLLRNWIINRGLRLVLIEIALEIFAYILLRTWAFYNKPDHLILLLVLNLILALLSYLISGFTLFMKERKND